MVGLSSGERPWRDASPADDRPADRPVVLIVPLPPRCGIAVWRSLTAAGFRVVCAGHPSASARLGRGAPPIHPCPDPAFAPEPFRAAVAAICRSEGVDAVLALEDQSQIALLSGHPLPDGVTLCGPTAEQYRRLCHKIELSTSAARAGLAHPASVQVGPDGIHDGDRLTLPVVVKPLLSEPGSVGGEIVVCRTPEERAAVVARMVGRLGGVLVQEMIEGSGVGVQFVRAGGALVAVEAVTLRRWPPQTGMGACAIFGPASEDALEATERLLAEIGYESGGQVQFIRGPTGLVVHDVNLRPPANVVGALTVGLDLPRLMVEADLQRLIPARPRDRRVRYVWLTGEIRRLTALPRGANPCRRASVLAVCQGLLGRGAVLDPGGPRALATEALWIARRARARARARLLAPIRRGGSSFGGGWRHGGRGGS